MLKKWFLWILAGGTILGLVFGVTSACQRADRRSATPAAEQSAAVPTLLPVRLAAGQRLRVLVTTSIVADVVKSVGGDDIELWTLMPLGADPHSFTATPHDLAALADAHVVFINGAGLEASLETVLRDAVRQGKVVPVSSGIELLTLAEAGHEEETHAEEGFDPHTWMDPHNVMVWVQNIESALSTMDPEGESSYRARAEEYTEALADLDLWIRSQVAEIVPANRKLVTDHTVFTYFAHRYGFEQVGAMFPGYSTMGQPSAQELAQLESAIRANQVKVVFVSKTVNPALAQRVAEDTGSQIVFLYTGSLSEPGGPADTYLSMMRHNVTAIVQGLR